MASTSASSVKSFKYDVFLSFRGDDTRNNFVSHLYKSLEQNGIQTYMDDKKIEKGETIDIQLMKSIEDSRYYIIVFSKDYAGSSWCLDELVKIMECRKVSEQTTYPVFYDVEPKEIRNQSGAVGEAFEKHENKEAAGKWRKALNEAGNLAGDESKLIQIIVDDIFQKISSSTSSVDRNLVGMETRIEAVLSSLEFDTNDVRVIGIWGMGGGGKTTLARAVFDRIFIQFDGKAFVENVREVSKSSLYGVNKLQEQILRSVLSNKDITVNSVHEGTNMIKTLLRGRKVLIVLDDVDNRDQLEALTGEPNEWFKFGSRVIITTRDKQVLSPPQVKLINVNMLSREEAICLLSKHAFKRDLPIEGYEELSGQVINYADGLPLTIKVLGATLYGQNKQEWIDTLERLRTIPLKETLEQLELSYKSLDDDYKQIFLDVACLLKGWQKDDAIRALESCGFHAKNGLRVLEQRSLINISDSGKLWMHDHVEEMGMNIVRRVNHNKPETHSRLWIQDEILDILANNSGTQSTKCIRLDARGFDFGILMKGLRNMKEVRFLQVDSRYVSEDEVTDWNLPNALRFLSWFGYPFSSLPKTFQAKNLVGLEMNSSLGMVQLWKDGEEKPFFKLKFLKITYSSKLRTLDLSVAPNLEKLFLEGCDKLVEVHFQVTTYLKELRISNCKRLKKLHMPKSPKLISLDLSFLKLRVLHLGITPNLETLRLRDCTDMAELRIPADSPKLVTLDLCSLKLRTLHLGITPNLETLRLRDCTDMAELRIAIDSPKLVTLDLCSLKLRTLHLGITLNLETVSLRYCHDLVEVHFQVTPNLKELHIYVCKKLDSLHMSAESPKLRSLDLNDLKLRTFHLGITPNLETLSLGNCTDIVELEIPAECPKLVNLHIFSNAKLRALDIGLTSNLESLRLKDCTDMVEFYMPADCPKLEDLELINLYLMTLHLGITPNLKWVNLRYNCDLVELWTVHFPAECPKLVKLDLRYCKQVVELPEEIGRLECLKELDISGTSITWLPESIFRLKGLLIVGSRWLFESGGFTSLIETDNDEETLCYI